MNNLQLKQKTNFQNNNGKLKIKLNSKDFEIQGNQVLNIDLPDGEYKIETNKTLPLIINLKNNRRIKLEIKPRGFMNIVVLLVLIPVLLKYGFSIDKIITFNYVTISLYTAAGFGLLLNTIGKKYTHKIEVV